MAGAMTAAIAKNKEGMMLMRINIHSRPTQARISSFSAARREKYSEVLGSVEGKRLSFKNKSDKNGLMEKTLKKKNIELNERVSKVREAMSFLFLKKILRACLRIPTKPKTMEDSIILIFAKKFRLILLDYISYNLGDIYRQI